MNTKTKTFLALLIVVIGGGLVYWKWQEPIIEVKNLEETETTITIFFKMSYKGIQYVDKIEHGTVWRKSKNGYTFEVISPNGPFVYFHIKNKDGSIVAKKTINIS